MRHLVSATKSVVNTSLYEIWTLDDDTVPDSEDKTLDFYSVLHISFHTII